MYKNAAKRLVKTNKPFPDKLFYKIGEVSRIAGIEPYVLRYWETEFPFLSPRKNRSGQRVYIKKDLEFVLQIKKLLYEKRYTIEGVRKKLGEPLHGLYGRGVSAEAPEKIIIEKIKDRLRGILSISR